MKTNSMLQKNSRFAGYSIVERLSKHHEGVREVYRVLNLRSGDEEVMTVFNLKDTRYAVDGVSRKRHPDFIDEVRFLMQNKTCSRIVPLNEYGISRYNKLRLAWMTQPYLDSNPLADEIRMQRVLSKEDAVKVMKALIEAIIEIRNFTRGGGHYNISLDNILVDYDGDNLRNVWLVGLAGIGTPYNGATSFTNSEVDNRFRAPETTRGIFNHITDVYALGIVMAMMLTGEFRMEIKDGMAAVDYSPATANDMSMDYADLKPTSFRKSFLDHIKDKLSTSLRLIIEKATNPVADMRFQSVEKFLHILNMLGNINVTTHVESSKNLTWRQTGSVDCVRGRKWVVETDDDEAEEDSTPNERFKTEAEQVREAVTRQGLDAVAGMDELKQLFRRNFVQIVQNPKMAKAYGITPCNCTLLYGPQGCGKTFIAEKAAQESGLKYKIVNPSDFGSIYIHGSQEKIAETFREAEKNAPMILIFDEFDAIAPKRDSDTNAHQANEVNELLTQLNNCAAKGVYVLAATNRPEMLDAAILRTGRVDQMFYVSLPDFKARHDIFALELEKRPCDADIDLDALANATENFTCSDLSYIVTECARNCFEEREAIASSTATRLSLETSNTPGIISVTVWAYSSSGAYKIVNPSYSKRYPKFSSISSGWKPSWYRISKTLSLIIVILLNNLLLDMERKMYVDISIAGEKSDPWTIVFIIAVLHAFLHLHICLNLLW